MIALISHKITEIQGLTLFFKCFMVIAMFFKKTRWSQWMTNMFKLSPVTLMILKNTKVNSRIAKYVQTFTDEFTDFNSKTLSNFHWCLSYFSRNQFESQEWPVFSSFDRRDLNDFQISKKARWTQWMTNIFKISLVTSLKPEKARAFQGLIKMLKSSLVLKNVC